MESAYNWEHKALLNELIQGKECAKQLRVHLNSATSSEAQHCFLQRIFSSYENSLLILKWRLEGRSQSVAPLCGPQDKKRSFKNQQCYNVPKKRKSMPTWTEQARVSTENGLDGPTEDGYSWRKYGQKDILGAKYPRSYYRCTFRHMQNCWATKQVQRSDDDPTVFDITYKGGHTCHLAPSPVSPLASPENQELKQPHHQNESLHALQSNEMLINSPIVGLENSLDLSSLEPIFPFDNLEFLT